MERVIMIITETVDVRVTPIKILLMGYHSYFGKSLQDRIREVHEHTDLYDNPDKLLVSAEILQDTGKPLSYWLDTLEWGSI
tara:strand:- start:418 stop:660 length:243 start_codon:yes stop_codon:yes gene_type:complete